MARPEAGSAAWVIVICLENGLYRFEFSLTEEKSDTLGLSDLFAQLTFIR